MRRALILLACATLAGCGSSGGSPAAPYTSAGDQQCAITYQVSGTKIALTVTTTVGGEFSYGLSGAASGGADETTVGAGTHHFTDEVDGFRRVDGTLTAADKTVYHCSVAPA